MWTPRERINWGKFPVNPFNYPLGDILLPPSASGLVLCQDRDDPLPQFPQICDGLSGKRRWMAWVQNDKGTKNNIKRCVLKRKMFSQIPENHLRQAETRICSTISFIIEYDDTQMRYNLCCYAGWLTESVLSALCLRVWSGMPAWCEGFTWTGWMIWRSWILALSFRFVGTRDQSIVTSSFTIWILDRCVESRMRNPRWSFFRLLLLLLFCAGPSPMTRNRNKTAFRVCSSVRSPARSFESMQN